MLAHATDSNSGLALDHTIDAGSTMVTWRRYHLVATTATLHLPLCFEDGLIAIRTDLVKEGDAWKIAGEADTLMR